MNSVNLIGRLTEEPETRYTQDGTCVCRFTLAVDRRFKKDGGDSADFIRIVAFGKTGEFADRYFSKGLRVGITGRIQTGKYENKEGKTVYTTDVVAEAVDFADGKQQTRPQTGRPEVPEEWTPAAEIPEELPFN